MPVTDPRAHDFAGRTNSEEHSTLSPFATRSASPIARRPHSRATTPAYPIKPEQVSDKLMGHITEWKEACREILTETYRYPAKPEKESPFGHGSVRSLARRGTGRFNEILVAFTWDKSSKPKLTLRPGTRLEASVLSCHLAKLAGWKFRQCRSCGTVFALLTDHRKIYCDYPCAHREAVRASRRQAKQATRRRSKKGGK